MVALEKLLCTHQEDPLRWQTLSSFKIAKLFVTSDKYFFFFYPCVFLPYESYLTISSKLSLPTYYHGASQAIWVPEKPINPEWSKFFTVGHLNQFGKDFGCCTCSPTGMSFKEPNIISFILAKSYRGQSILNYFNHQWQESALSVICLSNPQSLGRIKMLFLLATNLCHTKVKWDF